MLFCGFLTFLLFTDEPRAGAQVAMGRQADEEASGASLSETRCGALFCVVVVGGWVVGGAVVVIVVVIGLTVWKRCGGSLSVTCRVALFRALCVFFLFFVSAISVRFGGVFFYGLHALCGLVKEHENMHRCCACVCLWCSM